MTDIAFTILSLEQLPDQNLKAIQNIHSRVKMGSIHVEPVCENYPYNFRGVMGNRNAFEQLREQLPLLIVEMCGQLDLHARQ